MRTPGWITALAVSLLLGRCIPAGDGIPDAVGPNEVRVQGDWELHYQATRMTAALLVDSVVISLMADEATGVALFLPAVTPPGTHLIGDLFQRADAAITARFDRYEDGRFVSYESTDGRLVLAESGASFSGSFSFTAVHTPEGDRPVSVEGNFEGVVLGH
jgi:hypothetical protein